MAFCMRKSKFRHVFGKAYRREQCYDNIRVTKISWDSTYCSVNPKFLAVITEAAGGGAFLVLPLAKTGRVPRDTPLVVGHRAAVLSIAWCPFHDEVIASSSEDCTIKIWQIPDGGLSANLTEPIADLTAHQRRVGLIIWHPSANNILLSAGSDNKIFLWNVGTCEMLTEVDMPDLILSASFNYNGSKVVTTSKDKFIRIIDPRTGEIIQEGKGHEGSKASQVVYLKDGRIFTTGFSRMSERQYALWDEKNLSSPLQIDEVDSSNGVVFPFYDPDNSVVYTCGRGDSIIRYYEITTEKPYVNFLNLYQSKEAQRGFGFMPKRGMNVNSCEIARIYKLYNTGLCEVIPFTVPRKSELFQDDLYPDTAGTIPALSADAWLSGKNADPVLVSLKEGYKPSEREQSKVVRKSNILDTMPAKTTDTTNNATNNAAAPTRVQAPAPRVPSDVLESAAAAAVPTLPPKFPDGFDENSVLEELKTLRELVKKQDRRIEDLENRLTAMVSGDENFANKAEEEDS